MPGGTGWRNRPFVPNCFSMALEVKLTQGFPKEAFGVPAQTKPGSFKSAVAKAVHAAIERLSALAPQPVLQPIPVRVKADRRR